MKKPLTFLLSLTFLFLFCATVSSAKEMGNMQAAETADEKVDYKTFPNMVISFFEQQKILAEQGHATAQYNLGDMYLKGAGVPQDYQEAVKWYRLAAEQGHASAQYNLGVRYRNGEGVPQDYVSAHMWLNLAGSNGDKDAIERRNTVEKKMSRTQIEKTQEMARNWKPSNK